jgi:hypothetical protein
MSGEAESKERRAAIDYFAKLLRPRGIPPSPLHEILQEAARQAGWTLPSAKAQNRQKVAARARTVQREQDLAVRRIAVACCFKRLPARLQRRPQSTATVQAIIGKIDQLKLPRMPPMTQRTIQADIRFLKDNGNFGI